MTALTDLNAAAQELVNAEKGLETPEKVMEGVGHILSEAISEMAAVRDAIRKIVWKTGKIVTSKGDIPDGQGLEYRDYFDYSEPLSQVPPHRVLAINRGDKEGPLKIRLDVSRPELEAAFFHQLPLEGHPQAEVFRAAAIDALDRLILPSMEREVRRDLTEAAERHAVEVFARNLRSLLLQPPIPKQVVMAIDPGLRSGCKVAVLDRNGNLLDQTVIYPHAPQNRRSEAKLTLKDLVGKFKVGVVAIGNGTACRETEELIAEIIAEGVQFSQGQPSPEANDADRPAQEGETAAPSEFTPPAAEPEVDSSAPREHGAAADASASTSEPEAPHLPEPQHEAHEQHGAHEHRSERDRDGLGPGSSSATESTENTHMAALEPGPSPALTEESLPPISGGAPEPASTEADTTLPSDQGPTEPETSTDHPAPRQNSDSSHAAASEGIDGETRSATRANAHAGDETHFSASVETETSVASHSPTGEPAPADDAQAGQATSSGDDAPSGSSPDEAAVAGTGTTEIPQHEGGEEVPSAAASKPEDQPSAQGPSPAGGESRPAGEPRRGGSGRHEHGRSRGPRTRPASTPPPLQSPPAPHAADHVLAQLAYVIVNEAGASVYSTSQVGRDELPEFDATLRSAISIGRRLQDPLAELVKIEPQNIGVGLYQHDVNPKQLKETLESVISSCVNFVGVDLNTASVPLLRHVSGLNQLTARRIVDHRKEKGPFTGRDQLMSVEGIGPATYTQAAGFLKIPEGGDPLDRTWIHPESYEIATRLLEKLGFAPEILRDKEQLPELQHRLSEANPVELAKDLGVGELTLKDIIEALGRPERDPRDDLPKPIFKKGILKLEDLTAGMELKGTVLNVVDFGAFVDIGLKDSGLVHISQLANRYIKSPHDVVSVGDVVTVWVMSVDQERKRVSLTMVKPGTERPRGGGQGGQRRGQGQPAGEPREGQGQGRRDRGRTPRPSGSALTSPPVGAAPIASLAEPAARRHERDRDRPGGPGPQGHPGTGDAGHTVLLQEDTPHRVTAQVPGQGQGLGAAALVAVPSDMVPAPAVRDRDGPSAPRGHADPAGPRGRALRLPPCPRRPSPVASPCARSASSSNSGRHASRSPRVSSPAWRKVTLPWTLGRRIPPSPLILTCQIRIRRPRNLLRKTPARHDHEIWSSLRKSGSWQPGWCHAVRLCPRLRRLTTISGRAGQSSGSRASLAPRAPSGTRPKDARQEGKQVTKRVVQGSSAVVDSYRREAGRLLPARSGFNRLALLARRG